MPVHLAFVAASTLLGAWLGEETAAPPLLLLQLGAAAGLAGFLRSVPLPAKTLLCCLCAFCCGASSAQSLPVGPEISGWTSAQGPVSRRHDGWLILEDHAGPIALAGLQAEIGDSIAVFGRARPLAPREHQSSWSRERGAFDAGIRTVLYVKRKVALKSRGPSPFANSSNQAFLDRVVLGRATEINETQNQLLRNTGTRHLLAISGLHVGLMSALGALALSAIGRLIALFWRPRALVLLPAVGGCLSALLYASNAGFPTSTIRATCMLFLAWCCWLFGRKPQPWRLFCLALIFCALLAPERIKTLSFGLSFSAAAGVIQSLHWTRSLPSGLHPLPGWCLRALAVSLGAQLGTLAWSAWVFQELPLFAVLANLLAVPLVGFLILPSGLLSSLGVPGAMRITEGSCEVFWTTLELLEGPLMHPAVGPFGALGLLLSVLCMHRPSAWLTAVLLSLGLKSTPSQGLKSTHFDVGQGDSSLVEIAGNTRILIDAGPRKTQVLHALRQRGIRSIDALILSHDHLDHSGGMLAILSELQVGCLLMPDSTPVSPTARELSRVAYERGVLPCNRERPLPMLRTLQLTTPSLGVNDRSIVVEAVHGGRSFLYLGDLENEGEGLLLSKLGPVDGIKVAHHGSRSSTTAALLNTTRPRICVISSGAHNSYGHPHRDTLDRLESCEVLQTAERGDLTIYLPPLESTAPQAALFLRPTRNQITTATITTIREMN